jgi:uncharacterized protein (DUF488 family)
MGKAALETAPPFSHPAGLNTPLYTIGYEGLVQPQLIELLAASGVAMVLDVRAVPLSRKAGFSKSMLAASLQAGGIAYRHDRRLGTPKPGREAARHGRTDTMVAIFREHMADPSSLEGLEDAIVLASTAPICLLCFEREPHDCHRSIVAQMIQARTGQTIRHL